MTYNWPMINIPITDSHKSFDRATHIANSKYLWGPFTG